jgi:CPA2 family monovalent cation:H+ antiporter-2
MHGQLTLINTIAAGLGLALIFGFLCTKARLPALVGYLIAGMVIGPYTPGFVADAAIAAQLAEIGVMLLMFGVGLHFSLDDLLSVRKIALPGAVVQMVVATLMGFGLATWWGWEPGPALVLGISLSVASTVVLLRALESLGILGSMTGRIAVGWLVVEDLAMVLVLVLLPPLAGFLGGAAPDSGAGESIWSTLGMTLLRVGAFVAVMLVIGRKFFPWVLWQVTHTGSRELFTLCVVAAAVGIAFASAELFGVSFALGAFFAGMVLRESEFSHRAAQESLPLRDAFAVLFFVSVGMLFDPYVLVKAPVHVLGVVAIIILGKSLAAAALVLALRYPLNTALTVSASLAQIGEFSFILVGLGAQLGLMPDEGHSLVLAGALISIALNPLLFKAIQPLQALLREHSPLVRRLEARDDPLAELPRSTESRFLSRQVVLVGHGRVGRRIAEVLKAAGQPFVVADQNREIVEALRAQGVAAVVGDAGEPEVLIQAHIAHARMLVVATQDTLSLPQMIETARTLNPEIRIVVRSHNEDEAERLMGAGVDTVFLGEAELAQAMARHVLAPPPQSTATPAVHPA